MSFLPIVVALFLIFLAYSIWTRSRNPYGLPQVSFNWPRYISLIMSSRTKGTISRALVEATTEYRSKFGEIFVLPMFGKNLVVLCGDEVVNWAIKHERDDNLKRILPGNMDVLLANNNDFVHTKSYWKKNREVLSSILMQSTAVNNFIPTMVTTIHEQLSKSSVIDNNTLSNFAFDIGWLFVVGKHGKEYMEKVAVCYKNIRDAVMAVPVNLPGTAFRKGLQARAEIQKIINKIIESDPTLKTDPNNILGTIIENYPTQIGVIVLGLLFGATSTTVNVLSGLVWTLINNPRILEKLQNEIRGVDCEPQSVVDLHKFPYLNKVVHETLRLYGGGTIGRETKVPLTYKNHVFPKNTPLLIIIGNDHYSVTNPKEFDPEREEKYKWEPFGGAPRNCLGKVFALLEIKMFFFHLLKYYDVTPEKEPNATVFVNMHVRLQNARLRHKSIIETK